MQILFFFLSFFLWGRNPNLVTQDPKLSRGLGTARIRPQAEASSRGFAIPCPVKCLICTISPEVNGEIDLFQNAYNPSCEVRSSRHYPMKCVLVDTTLFGYTIHLFAWWVGTYLKWLLAAWHQFSQASDSVCTTVLTVTLSQKKHRFVRFF